LTENATFHTHEDHPLKVRNLTKVLQEARLDPDVNIKIASLGGDEKMMMGVTELQPGAKINAHVHAHDAEIYYILRGEGEMYIGTQNELRVSWNNPVKVKEGDVFTIDAGVVHQLKNASKERSLILMFSTPWSHLKGDRVITEDYDHAAL
jgi:mannose-6-phosphate isomerase-like protein (cupin superfamily)